MMDKITNDLMNGKGENTVTKPTEPLFCAENAMETEQSTFKKPKKKTTRESSKNAKIEQITCLLILIMTQIPICAPL